MAALTGPLSPPVFQGDLYQCEPVTVSWTGGSYPIRVEAFYQRTPTSTWRHTGVMPAEAASTDSIEWIANIPAGSIAWITLVDHAGEYRQTTQGSVVKSSSNSSCLQPDNAASVVTATVFMTDGHRTRGAVDNKALLISAVLFGILFFACLGGIVYMYSLLRQARRLRGDRARFGMADDDDHSISGSRNYAAVVGRHSRDARSRKLSEMSEAGTLVPAATTANVDEKKAGRPTSATSEHNPFLDPPSSANSFAGVSYPSMQQQNQPSVTTRPQFTQTISEVDTLSSATSMQLFGMTGGLRVMNDPAQISTPNLSRAETRTSQYSRYPHSTGTNNTDVSMQPGTSSGGDVSQVQASESGHSEMSHSSLVSSTENHYSSEPHSSKIYLPQQQSAKGQ